MKVKKIFDAVALTVGDTSESDIISLKESDGSLTIIGEVASATGHREVKVEAYISADGTNFTLDQTTVASWNLSPGDTDNTYAVEVTVKKAPYIQMKLTGLANCVATANIWLIL